MRIRLAHGSKKNQLTELRPMYMGGDNGSQDGIGINLTADGAMAYHYAGKSGSVYLADIDTSRFLTISDTTPLGHGHAEILKMHLATLPEKDQYRLATDICGKARRAFDDDNEAEAFYKEKRQAFRDLGFSHDRLKPDIDYDEDGRMLILYARKDFDNLHEINTRRIHYCLNLHDNSIATSLFKTVCNGLVLERESGKHHYLSFRASEAIAKTLTHEMLKQPDAAGIIDRACHVKSPDTPSEDHEMQP